jgi:hypothetical protein
MHATSVVRLMTPNHRVKDPADADLLPRSFEARSPAKEPGLLFFHCSTEHSAGAASTPLRLRSVRSLTTCTECRAGSGPRSTQKRQAPRPNLGRPAPSRVCPRTSTGRPGVHVRSGGRLSRAATLLWLAQAGRVACGHSRDGSTRSPLANSRLEGRKPAATIGRRRNPSPTTFSVRA